jgi:hypothetical protein
MIPPSAFRPASYQAVSFYTNVQVSVARLLPPLLESLAGVTDGDPIVLPIPEQAPPEVPRIILISKDQTIRVEIALARVDVRWQQAAGRATLARDEFVRFAQKAFTSFNHTLNAVSTRLAFVIQRFQPDDDPAKALAHHFCRPDLLSNDPKGPLNRPENFELHAHKTYEMKGFRINSWVRCKTGILAVSDAGQRIVLVEQDLNTLTDAMSQKQYDSAAVERFFEAAVHEVDSILAVYFPQERKAVMRTQP